MEFGWYNIFSKTEFEATGLVSRTLSVFLEGVGQKDILITKGNTLGVLYDGVFMPVEFADQNPYVRSPYAVFLDLEGNVWLGIEEPEE